MNRLPGLDINTLNSDQLELFDRITKGKRSTGRSIEEFIGTDGAMIGPFNAMLHHPSVGQILQRLGEVLRFEGGLSDIHREIAVLTVGRHWRAEYEWWAHAQIARKVGISSDIIEAIKDQKPLPCNDIEILTIHNFVRETLENQRVRDETYSLTYKALGDLGIVELVILIGYYGIISGILNTFNVPLPRSETSPFEEKDQT